MLIFLCFIFTFKFLELSDGPFLKCNEAKFFPWSVDQGRLVSIPDNTYISTTAQYRGSLLTHRICHLHLPRDCFIWFSYWDLADRKAAIWNILVTVSEEKQALQGLPASLFKSGSYCFYSSFIGTSKRAFSYPPQEGQKALSQWSRKLDRVSMPHSLPVLPGKFLHFRGKKKPLQDSVFFRLLLFAHSCPHENDFKYCKMCKERKFGN